MIVRTRNGSFLRTLAALGVAAPAVVLVLAACGSREPISPEPAQTAGGEVDRRAANAGIGAPDAAVTAKVKEALALQEQIPALRLEVETKDGVVTLRGTVPSEEAKRAAETTAAEVAGVRRVENLVRVGP